MKERPILMSAPMVRAILEGRKTQTRRALKCQPKRGWTVDCWPRGQADPLDPTALALLCSPGCLEGEFTEAVRCPYGGVGDRLWVKETFVHAEGRTLYRADYEGIAGRWKPSIFMPRAASRITLEVTGVRVERLHDISEADAQAEGILHTPRGWCSDDGQPVSISARRAYEDLWHSINGSWRDCWVWVVEFRRVA